MTRRRMLKFLTLALMVSFPPVPAENATGYHLLSAADATKHLSNPSVPRMNLAQVRRIADTATNFGIIRIKKVPGQPFATTPVFYMFDQDAAGLMSRYEPGLLLTAW